MVRVRTGNRELIRELNTNLVLNTIRQTGSTSQVEISQQTRLSAGTVTSIVQELKKGGFVKEVGRGKSAVGRRPTLLRFNPEARYVLSAAFFADQTHVAVLDLAGTIKNRDEFFTRPERGPEPLFVEFAECAERLISGLKIRKEKLLGVGVGFEGIINSGTGVLILSTRFNWNNVEIKAGVEKSFGIETVVNSEGAAMALGEYRQGAGAGHGEVICIDVDAGIGAVEVSEGQVRQGKHNMAGEIGHTTIVPDGKLCNCGRRGCLETVASGRAIIAAVTAGLAGGAKSMIPEEISSYSTRSAIKAIFDAARKGDNLARRVINESGRHLGLAIAGIVNYADPELVVLTGCVSDHSKGILLDIVRKHVQEHIVDGKKRVIPIEEGKLGEDAVLIGAATEVYERTFKLPVSY